MATVDNLREHCKELRKKREEELKTVLDDYFDENFITKHRPFRAVIGNKKCKPIPIHNSFGTYRYQWPNFSEELLRHELENLGFVVGGSVKVITALNGNVIVKVKESRVAISDEMARRIMI